MFRVTVRGWVIKKSPDRDRSTKMYACVCARVSVCVLLLPVQ